MISDEISLRKECKCDKIGMSELEDTLAWQLTMAGIPFEREARFCSRRWRWDFALPGKIAVEVQGGLWRGGAHNRGRGVHRDIEKHNRAVELGWLVLYVTAEMIDSGEALALIERVLAGRDV